MPLSLLIVLGIFALFLILRNRAPGVGNPATVDFDVETFRALERSGADLTRPHLIECFLYFERESDANAAAATLSGEGYGTTVTREPDEEHWLCLATRQVVPDLSQLRVMSQRLREVAEAHGGGYDGWGTEVDDGSS